MFKEAKKTLHEYAQMGADALYRGDQRRVDRIKAILPLVGARERLDAIPKTSYNPGPLPTTPKTKDFIEVQHDLRKSLAESSRYHRENKLIDTIVEEIYKNPPKSESSAGTLTKTVGTAIGKAQVAKNYAGATLSVLARRLLK